MKDAYDNSRGRHDVYLEEQFARYLYTKHHDKLIIHKSNFTGSVPLKYFIDNCQSNVFIIGDSHNRIFKHIPIRKHLKIRGSTTMFRVYRDGIQKLLNPNHDRKIRGMESKRSPHQGDVCFFSFGYVDIINNILKHNTSIQEMVDKYISEIINYADDTRIYPIVQIDTVAQPSDLTHQHVGSIPERIQLQMEMYECLKSTCIDKKLSCFEYTSEYVNFDGTFDAVKALSEDGAHIGHSYTNSVKCSGCEKCKGANAQYIWERFYNTYINMH